MNKLTSDNARPGAQVKPLDWPQSEPAVLRKDCEGYWWLDSGSHGVMIDESEFKFYEVTQ